MLLTTLCSAIGFDVHMCVQQYHFNFVRCDPDGLFSQLVQESGEEEEIMDKVVALGMDGNANDTVLCEL